MMSADQEPTKELQQLLAELEDRLETPVVPGEIMEWCGQVESAFERLRTLYEDRVRPAHGRQFAVIRKEDPGLDPHVTQMAEEDEAIVNELERLGLLLNVLAGRVDSKAETADGLGTDARLADLVARMLTMVIRIRSFEKALQTWFVEAFQRDRGVVD